MVSALSAAGLGIHLFSVFTNALVVYIIGVMSEGLAGDGIPDDRRVALSQDQDGQEFRMRRFGAMAQVAKLLVYALILWTLKASLLYYFSVRITVSHIVLRRNQQITRADLWPRRVTFLGQDRECGPAWDCSWSRSWEAWHRCSQAVDHFRTFGNCIRIQA